MEELVVGTERLRQQLGDGPQVVARGLLPVTLFDRAQDRELEQCDIALSVLSHQRQKVRSGLRWSRQACGTLEAIPLIEIHGFPVRFRTPHFLGALHQFSLRRLAAILRHAGVDRGDQHIAFAGLGEELQDASSVHRVDRRIHVGVAGQQHSYRLRRPFPHQGEELRAVHARHPHIRYDDGERAPFLEDREPLRAADCGADLELPVQDSLVALQRRRFVVDTQDLFLHESCLPGARAWGPLPTQPAAATRSGEELDP